MTAAGPVFLRCSCSVRHQLEFGTTTACPSCGDLLDADFWDDDEPECLGCGADGHTLEDHATNPDL